MKTNRQRDEWTSKQTDKQAERVRQTIRQMKSRQISRPIDRETYRHSDTQTELQFITFGMARTSSEGDLKSTV